MGKQILVFYLGSISQMTGFFGMWGPASGMWRPAGGMSREAAKVLLRSPINCYMPENNAMHLTSHWGAPWAGQCQCFASWWGMLLFSGLVLGCSHSYGNAQCQAFQPSSLSPSYLCHSPSHHFTPDSFVAGGHSLGRATLENSGFEFPWDNSPEKLDNGYYKAMKANGWKPDRKDSSILQWVNPEWESFGLPPWCPKRLCGIIEGRLSHFLPCWFMTGCPKCREKSLEILPRPSGNWTRTTEGTDREIHSFSHWAIMTAQCVQYCFYGFLWQLKFVLNSLKKIRRPVEPQFQGYMLDSIPTVVSKLSCNSRWDLYTKSL